MAATETKGTTQPGVADLLAEVKSLKAEIAEKSRPQYVVDPGKLFAEAKHSPERKSQFKSLNHFCHDIRLAEVKHEFSPVLKEWEQVTKAASGMNETVGSEGGFLVPPEFSTELFRRTYDNDLLSRTKSYPVSGNSLSIPAIDETSRVDGSRFGGVRAYWESEAAQFTATKPAYSRIEGRLKKLIGLCYVTDELLMDSSVALEQHLMDLFAQEISFKVGDSIVNGTGAGMPQGLLNAAALVSVSKETGQAAATVLYENVNKMYNRLWAPSRKNAVWLHHQDVEPALETMALNVGTGGMPVYLPPGGVSEKPYATLKGMPLIPVEFCQTLGTVGDLILVDLSQYVTFRKGETQQDSSIHFKFDTAETAFRVLFRLDGAPLWNSALTPKNGSNTLSFAVALNTRA